MNIPLRVAKKFLGHIPVMEDKNDSDWLISGDKPGDTHPARLCHDHSWPGLEYYHGLLVMAGLFGMGGSFISLALSKWIAKKSTGAQVIEQPGNPTEQWLVDTVRRLAKSAEIGMPEVAIYDSPDINAFATA